MPTTFQNFSTCMLWIELFSSMLALLNQSMELGPSFLKESYFLSFWRIIYHTQFAALHKAVFSRPQLYCSGIITLWYNHSKDTNSCLLKNIKDRIVTNTCIYIHAKLHIKPYKNIFSCSSIFAIRYISWLYQYSIFTCYLCNYMWCYGTCRQPQVIQACILSM